MLLLERSGLRFMLKNKKRKNYSSSSIISISLSVASSGVSSSSVSSLRSSCCSLGRPIITAFLQVGQKDWFSSLAKWLSDRFDACSCSCSIGQRSNIVLQPLHLTGNMYRFCFIVCSLIYASLYIHDRDEQIFFYTSLFK